MQVKDALNEIMDGSGLTRYAIAKKFGKTPNYVYKMMNQSKAVGYPFMSSIADVCGYDIALVKRDGSNTIILDPPSNE